ncbi:MAG: glycosyltransferase [Planctomycetota bacterium]
MRVFMLGWEFPPHISGGLGTACHGLTKGLSEIGVDVSFVLPTAVPVGTSSHVRFRTPQNLSVGSKRAVETGSGSTPAPVPASRHVTVHQLPAVLQAYSQPEDFQKVLEQLTPDQRQMMGLPEPGDDEQFADDFDDASIHTTAPPSGRFVRGAGINYGGDLMGQVYKYARLAVELARNEQFDVVHAHDWMTFPAGMAVAAACRKPLVVHIHSTEFDRSGENVNQQVYEIERMGAQSADRAICVSHLTAGLLKKHYGVPSDRLEVVYNAVEMPNGNGVGLSPIRSDEKIVLFLGRVTMQKGPEYFLQAAKRVVDKLPNVRFVVAGSGDMITHCIELAAKLKLGSHITFTGFLRGDDVTRVFDMADLYVMPSVSEPFGIAPLEALSHNVPVIISKQSGVSEVLTHALKVDFWDIDEMANKILAVLRHPPLQKTLSQHGSIELRKMSWRDSAVKLYTIYRKVSGVA